MKNKKIIQKAKVKIQNCKYNSVGADPCVRPSKGPCCLFKTINRVDTWVDPYKYSFAFCDLTFKFI